MKCSILRNAFLAAVACCMAVGTAQAKDILIGVDVPMTGSLARVGTGTAQGIETAAAVFNAKHDDYTIKLIQIDDESQPAKAVAAVEKLASEGVVAITGGYGSNNVGPASAAANELGLPYITSGAIDSSLTQRGFNTFFRINNAQGYRKAVVGLLETMQVKKVSILYSTKEATTHLAQGAEKALSEKGVTVSMHAFSPGMTSFTSLMNKVRLRDRPDAILMSGYENDYIGILRAARILKPDVKAMVGLWSLATPRMIEDFPKLMQNVYGTASLPYPVNFKTEAGRAFAKQYQALFHITPDYVAEYAFVQARVLFAAVLRAAEAGTLETGGVAKELAKTDMQTMIGRIRFDAKGDNVNFSNNMGQIQGDKIVIVWPDNQASGEMVFPGVPW